MRPLFAIAPLALALMLFGPVAQSPQPSLVQAVAAWFSSPQPAESAPAPLSAASATVASADASTAR